MALKIWLGDKLVDEQDVRISVFDHGLLYGDGKPGPITKQLRGKFFRYAHGKEK